MRSLPIRDVLVVISFLVNALIGAMVWREFLKLKRAVSDMRTEVRKET